MVRNSKKDWDSVKLEGHSEAPANAKRLVGEGRACGEATIEASLLHFHFHITEEVGSDCPRIMIPVKLAQLAYVAKGEGMDEIAAAFCENGSLRTPWLESVITRRLARNSPRTVLHSRRVALSYSDQVLGVHISFRNSKRVRAACEPLWLECDMYDLSPFFRRMKSRRFVAEVKQPLAGFENTGDCRTRFTVAVPPATDNTAVAPTILFKADSEEKTKDFESAMTRAGKRLFVQNRTKPTYDEKLTLVLFENQYAQPNMAEFVNRTPRIMVFDQFTK